MVALRPRGTAEAGIDLVAELGHDREYLVLALPGKLVSLDCAAFGVNCVDHQCAGGYGHQGEDIRPAECPPASENGERCDRKQQAVVAVRDAAVIRGRRDEAATLQVNSRTEHIRFRYMHMNPSAMNADGLLNGRIVTEGERIGVVSNYLGHPAGTSLHLHFDVQVFTRDGWIWVSPYVTLVSAYERLILGRGREIGPEVAGTPQPVAHALPEDVVKPDQHEGGSEEN